MNEKRMKTSVNIVGVSLHSVKESGWGVKIRAEQGGGSESLGFAVEKRVAKAIEGRIIAKITGKTDAQMGKGKGWQLYCVTNLMAACRTSIAEDESIHIAFL